VDSEVLDEVSQSVGAQIMGRRMFGGGDRPWDESWTGWWGEDPPFHTPVFVLTHHPREPLTMKGGTTFHFVTDGMRRRSSRPERPRATRRPWWPAAPAL
jgi:dihydrofolate reductase